MGSCMCISLLFFLLVLRKSVGTPFDTKNFLGRALIPRNFLLIRGTKGEDVTSTWDNKFQSVINLFIWLQTWTLRLSPHQWVRYFASIPKLEDLQQGSIPCEFDLHVWGSTKRSIEDLVYRTDLVAGRLSDSRADSADLLLDTLSVAQSQTSLLTQRHRAGCGIFPCISATRFEECETRLPCG